MKKIYISIILTACFVYPLAAESNRYYNIAKKINRVEGKLNKKTVAVLPFKAMDGIPSEYGSYVAEKITHELVQIGELSVVERTVIDRVLKEQELSSSGLIDSNSAVKIGKMLAVEAIITGTVSMSGKKVEIIARAVQTETGLILASAQDRLKDPKLGNIKHAGRSPDKSDIGRYKPVFKHTGKILESSQKASAIVESIRIVPRGKVIYLFGLIKNTGKITVSKPNVSIRFLDTGGKQLALGQLFGHRQLYPGEVLPVNGILTGRPSYAKYEVLYQPDIDQYETYVTGIRSSQEVFSKASLGLGYNITGVLKNENDFDVKLVKIVATLYDKKSAFIGSAYGYASIKHISAGTTSPFRVPVYTVGLAGKPARYVLHFAALRDN